MKIALLPLLLTLAASPPSTEAQEDAAVPPEAAAGQSRPDAWAKPDGSYAQVDPPPPPAPACSRLAARWAPVDPAEPSDWPAASRPAPHTATVIWSCRIGGHLLVVKARMRERGMNQCSGAIEGGVSVWVDRIKLVDAEEAGDATACFGQHDPVFVSVELDAGGRLTVCRDSLEADYRIQRVCRPVSLAGPVDPAYRPPRPVTPPGPLLIAGEPGFCGPLTARLRLDDGKGRDRSLERAALPGTRGWADSDLNYPDGDSIVADIDNDGRPDQVEMRSVLKISRRAGQLAWRPVGAPADRAWLAPALVATGPGQVGEDYLAYGYRPVRLHGRVYLYVRDRPAFEGDFDREAWEGSFAGKVGVTRALLALSPDGSARTVCAWGPRKRPEEFL